MIKIKDLEDYFGTSFEELIKDNDIVEIASDIDNLWEDYYKWEMNSNNNKEETKDYLKTIKEDFYKWVENCNKNDLLDYDLSTYQRHFKLENGKYYYLNNYI